MSREYLQIRNRTQSAKAYLAETQASRARGELIDKKWAYDSLAYLMVVFRQRSLLAHRSIARRLVVLGLMGEENEHAAAMAIGEDIHSLLNELAHLPEKTTDPNWLRTLEKKELGIEPEREHQPTPKEAQREQARATHRRASQTEAKRWQRAKEA